MAASKIETRERVVQSWLSYRKDSAGAFRTDGKSVYSYNHEIAYVGNAGVRILRDCHYSVTTAQHASSVRNHGNVDQIIPCNHSNSENPVR